MVKRIERQGEQYPRVMSPKKDDHLERALSMLERTDGIVGDSAELVDFDDSRWGGKYIVVRKDKDVAAVYKMFPRMGQPKAIRTEDGGVAFQVDSMSIGLKRMKRIPKGLLGQEQS